MKQKVNLSKSTLIRSIQCQKSLYLYKNYFHLRDKISKAQQARFDRGHDIGSLAQQLFPGGKDVSPKSPRHYQQSILATEYLVSQQYPVIYEAAFKADDVLVLLDILVCKDGKWYAYEVKSSKKISETYLQDAAIQYRVITQSGVNLEDFSIIYVNAAYEMPEEEAADLHQLFLETSVLETVRAKQSFIEEAIHTAKATLYSDSIPKISMGEHCDRPYTCDFKGYCLRHSDELDH
ncbi:MAG: hypothetical protein R2730_01730 [Chitinophagales bacterium]